MNDWVNKDKAYVWHPYTSLQGAPDPILIESAQGVYLHTGDGRKILDAVSSWWVNIHGHSNEYLIRAMSEQASVIDHIIFAGFTHRPAIELAERLLKILPGNQQRIFYSDNGSTAVEVALKMAVQYWFNQGKRKNRFIAINGAYHGDTFGAMSIAERGAFTEPFHSMLFEVDFIDFPDGDNESRVIEQFAGFAKNNQIAAFIYEPLVQGAAGMRIYSEKTLNALLEIAHKHDIICIADEVMTGFGRTGKLFASDYCEIKPDIMCLSKGITGGLLPLGVTVSNHRITSAFDAADKEKTLFHGHSFTANAISCALSNASLDLLLDQSCQDRISEIASSHSAFLKDLAKIPAVKKAKSLGTILSIELKTSESTGYFNNLRNFLYQNFLERDILLRPLGNVIYIIPPYVIEKQELILIYKAIEEVLIKLPVNS